MRAGRSWLGVCVVLAVLLAACAGGDGGDEATDAATGDERGIDPDEQVIRIGALFDLSGPLALLGVPWEAAVSAGIEQLNESGDLDGWRIELVSRDHGLNPANAVSMYEEINDEVALIFPSFGSVTTAPLVSRFADDDMLAFVAGGASNTDTEHTIWGFPSYRTEAMRVVDHAVETGGDDVVLGIIHGEEDSGADALDGFREASDALDVEIAEEVSVEVTADEFTAAVTRLQDAGVTHACICIGAAHSSGILATAAGMDYQPQWYGMLPTFLEAVFYGSLPAEVWEDNFLWVTGIPFWGEDRPGMEEFVAAYESSAAAADFPGPQFWAMLGFLHVQQLGEVLSGAIESDDLSPDGIMDAASQVTDFDAGGLLLAPVDLLAEGQASTVTRVLSPNVGDKTWEVVGEEKSLDW